MKKFEVKKLDGAIEYNIPKYEVMLVKESSILADRVAVKAPDDVSEILMPYLRCKPQEHFIIAMMSSKNCVIGIYTVSIGSLSHTIVHPREVFRAAILGNCASIILAHNHPSGDPSPSPEDVELTKRLVEAGDLMCVKVLDHIVIGDNRFYSFKAEGLIQ